MTRSARLDRRLRAHVSEERYDDKHELFPLSQRTGELTYVMARPFLLEPEMILTVALGPQPDPEGAIGHVTGSEVKRLRALEIGNAQAWYYPADRTIVLWECFLEAPFRTNDPATDPVHTLVWQGFESFLRGRFPEATRFVTTIEPIYERPVYQAFLEQQGYRSIAAVAFEKVLAR